MKESSFRTTFSTDIFLCKSTSMNPNDCRLLFFYLLVIETIHTKYTILRCLHLAQITSSLQYNGVELMSTPDPVKADFKSFYYLFSASHSSSCFCFSVIISFTPACSSSLSIFESSSSVSP